MRLIDKDALLAEYDRVHIGEAGKARKLIEDAPEVSLYTENELQKIQDMQSAEVEKAFELGREDAKTQWISCKDRLPEEGKDVLCCFCNGEHYRIIVSHRTDFNFWSGVGRTGDLIAWMSLPEPWKGEDNG